MKQYLIKMSSEEEKSVNEYGQKKKSCGKEIKED